MFVGLALGPPGCYLLLCFEGSVWWIVGGSILGERLGLGERLVDMTCSNTVGGDDPRRTSPNPSGDPRRSVAMQHSSQSFW